MTRRREVKPTGYGHAKLTWTAGAGVVTAASAHTLAPRIRPVARFPAHRVWSQRTLESLHCVVGIAPPTPDYALCAAAMTFARKAKFANAAAASLGHRPTVILTS